MYMSMYKVPFWRGRADWQSLERLIYPSVRFVLTKQAKEGDRLLLSLPRNRRYKQERRLQAGELWQIIEVRERAWAMMRPEEKVWKKGI
jgi:hypothetical protein